MKRTNGDGSRKKKPRRKTATDAKGTAKEAAKLAERSQKRQPMTTGAPPKIFRVMFNEITPKAIAPRSSIRRR